MLGRTGSRTVPTAPVLPSGWLPSNLSFAEAFDRGSPEFAELKPYTSAPSK